MRAPYHGCSSTCRRANTRTGDEMAHKVDLSWAARNRSKGEQIVAPGNALRPRLKVENSHRSTIVLVTKPKTPAEDPYASLRISLQKVCREFHPHNDNQRARQKTG